MNLIVDASVAVKWFLDEEGCEAARALLPDNVVFAPDLVLLETYNAVWKHWRRGEAVAAQLESLMPVLAGVFRRLHASSDLSPHAAVLSRELDHPIYDCIYLSLAMRERMTLVTVDKRLLRAAREAKIDARAP